MTVTAVRKDPEALTLTLTAEFDASPTRVWELWADPRQLERWWGPPTYPATFTTHDLAAGGRAEYHMTGPSGDQPRGYWDVLEADPPRLLVFRDGSANADGRRTTDFPGTRWAQTIEAIDASRTRMTIQSCYQSTAGHAGAVPGHGHGRGPHAGRRPDRRDPQGRSLSSMTTMTSGYRTPWMQPGAVLTYDVR